MTGRTRRATGDSDSPTYNTCGATQNFKLQGPGGTATALIIQRHEIDKSQLSAESPDPLPFKTTT